MITLTVSGAKPGGVVAAASVMFTGRQAEEGQVTDGTVEVVDVCFEAMAT
jgi:hypothetical protein